MNEMIRQILGNVKKVWYIPLMIAIGIVFMLVQTQPNESVAVSSGNTNEQYLDEMERCVAEMLERIEGAENSVVTITLADGGSREYVRENGNVLVITDDEGNQSAVVSKEIAPEIAGVTVACSGAGSVTVRENVIRSVSTVLGIGTNKVCVVSIGR